MPETTNNTPRLLAAAKEFNIGKETLIDFLGNKGFDMDGFGSPNARLTAVMYTALQSEFQQDKANKRKSDQIALPKGSVLETMKKKEKEEAEAAAKKNTTKEKEEAAPAPKQEAKPEPKPEPVKETPKPEPQPQANVAQATPPPAKEKAEPKPEPPVVTAPPVAEVPKAPATPPPAEPDAVKKTDSPKINGPKVITTIDLDALNRNKKPVAKKADQEETPAPQPEAVKPPVKEEKPAPVTPAPPVAEKPEPKPVPAPPVQEATTAPTEKPVEKADKADKVEQAPKAETTPPAEKVAKTDKTDTTEKTEKAAPVEDKPVVNKVEEVLQEAKPAAVKEPAHIPVKHVVKTENRKPSTAENTPPTPPPAAPQAQDEASGAAVIENIQAEKLTGPKVIGKIELPVQSDRRDNNKNSNFSRDEKRKRKRIIVEKKPEPVQPKDFKEGDRKEGGAPGEHRPHQHGGQGGNRPHHNDNRGGGHQGQGGGNRPQGDNRNHNRPGGANTGTGGGNYNRPAGQGQGQGGGYNRPAGQGGPGGGGNRPAGQGGGYNRPGGGPGGGGNRPGQGGGYNRPGQGQGGYNRPGQHRGEDKRTTEEKEIDKNEIQNKIKETMAKLGGGGRGKNVKAKHRREKREERANQKINQGDGDNKLQVTEFVSVSELANLMDVSFAEVISKCMGLGIMVSINQRLDAEVIELVAGEFGYEVEFIGLEDAEETDDEDEVDDPADLEPRAPIVTIMGHVDHGKTSLLDYIRSANVVAGEAGGITQHIGAYQVTTASGKKITFLDTPGHEAFTAMRARGAKAADIAVIVIAADDAIMPQTKEAISHSQAAGLPMVFAINKVDKEGSNPERIKEQLAGMNLLVEDWGGKYQSQEISAKSGLNIDVLLEKILLEAELLELKANPDREASGSIVEATLDKGRGYVASLLVQNGTLRQGDTIVSGSFFGKIKAMFNERGQKMEEAGPSMPVQVLGLNGAPQAGEKFKMYSEESEAKEVANRRAQIVREQGIRTKKHITLDEIGRRLALGNFKQLNLIIKADFDGSVEALSDSLQKLSTEEIVISIVHKAVGQITESDVLLATASDAIILGFQVRPSSQAAKLAEKENIEIRNYSIIYDAIDEIKSAMEGMLEPKIEKKVVCNVQVRETYKFEKVTVAGCFVIDGKLTRNTRINVVRDGIVVHTGELGSLKRYKDDVKEVAANMECGLSVRGYSDLRPNDNIEGFEEVEVKRTL
ncbi:MULTISPECIES: translation initiation factor IF-2 [Chitinophaga]|uniref:translation initiation factor IF-2 n=1 Tax=Chitinophaga TaxID=79328 RepID=UPI000DB9C627|nr:translation initiation factor IF-2 [Chitinophaga ginsengisegetis]MDR6566107.1 translation initiation factor IF-2 [Chitinophaga ginsengisegetis]MDR6645837.1 translation initiation factor IF-2 [Chitinophaga ginsengisegetis]MDR6651571.1 translation initiation factor IF-2 [Chitinophaga ginsengisegetis]